MAGCLGLKAREVIAETPRRSAIVLSQDEENAGGEDEVRKFFLRRS